LVSGATEPDLPFASLSLDDAGSYTCQIQNTCSVVESLAAQVWVLSVNTWPEMISAWPFDAELEHDLAPLGNPDGLINMCDLVLGIGCVPSD